MTSLDEAFPLPGEKDDNDEKQDLVKRVGELEIDNECTLTDKEKDDYLEENGLCNLKSETLHFAKLHKALILRLCELDSEVQKNEMTASFIERKIEDIFGAIGDEDVGDFCKNASEFLDNYIHRQCAVEINDEYLQLIKQYHIHSEITRLVNGLETYSGICKICLKEPISHAFVPCGHTVCQDCFSDINRVAVEQSHPDINCHICRGGIRETLKIYL